MPVWTDSGLLSSAYYHPTTQYTFLLDTSHVVYTVALTMSMGTTFTLLTHAYVLVIHQDSTQSLFRPFPYTPMLIMLDLSYILNLHSHQISSHVDLSVITSYASAYGNTMGETGPVRTTDYLVICETTHYAWIFVSCFALRHVFG